MKVIRRKLLLFFIVFSTVPFIYSIGVQAIDLSDGTKFQDCADCPVMIVIPPGAFTMGSDKTEMMRDNEKRPEGPIREMTISKPFAVGTFEITNAQWEVFIDGTGYIPSNSCEVWGAKGSVEGYNWVNTGLGYPPKGNEPVVCITWLDAKAYTKWLSEYTGKKYRLLSEAEWEYVAKAGSKSTWPWGDDVSQICKFGNVFDQSGGKEKKSAMNDNAAAKPVECDDQFQYGAPVGSFLPNAFGVYDTIGNVWEWTEDCSVKYYDPNITDETAFQVSGQCKKRSVRSGSWRTRISRHRTSFRGRDPEDIAYHHFGLRVARDLN
jgi:formylglycine-generating enzyme required for sulfatase activity